MSNLKTDTFVVTVFYVIRYLYLAKYINPQQQVPCKNHKF